jgi:hypothetical protein
VPSFDTAGSSMRTALTGLLLFTASSLAWAAEGDPEARLSWQLSFGANRALDSGYSLAFGYREAADLRSDAPLLKLAELAVRDHVPVATLAGVPVYGGLQAAGQTEGIAYSSSPIYWVWWVVTGAVVTVVALDAGDSDDDPAPAGTGGGG